MKKALTIILISTLLINCDDDSDPQSSQSPVIDEWHLVEVLADPGGGDGTFRPVESNQYIRFHQNGEVTSNGSLCFLDVMANKESEGTYSLEEKTIRTDGCFSDDPVTVYFKLEGPYLIINYPCIERCQAKFLKSISEFCGT